MAMPESVGMAKRAIDSCAKFGLEAETWPAITPGDDPAKMFREMALHAAAFDNKWNRPERAMSAFLSHRSLWERSVSSNEALIVLEHDAQMIGQLPAVLPDAVNLGRPSFGRFNVPKRGVGPLVSKRYFPGAHAYGVQPARAVEMLARTDAAPTDVYLRLDRFPWLKEAFPWPFKVDESFSTIQNRKGCNAKHQNGPGYRLL
jgi:hypothetical protein